MKRILYDSCQLALQESFEIETPILGQRSARPISWSRDQDHRDQQVGLVIETETETQISKVSRPRLFETQIFLGCRDRDSSRPKNF